MHAATETPRARIDRDDRWRGGDQHDEPVRQARARRADRSAFYRMAFGGGMLLIGLIALGQWRRVSWSDIGWLMIPGVAFAADLMLWHRSILYVGPGLATLLGNFQVFLMALAGFLIYRERLGWQFLAGVALAFVGLVPARRPRLEPRRRAVPSRRRARRRRPASRMRSICCRRGTRSARGHVRLAPAQLLCVSSLLCAGILGIAALVEGDSFALPDTQTWSALLGLGFFGQVLGWVLLTRAMPQLPASLIGLLLLLQPALSFVFDVILFARPTRALDWSASRSRCSASSSARSAAGAAGRGTCDRRRMNVERCADDGTRQGLFPSPACGAKVGEGSLEW